MARGWGNLKKAGGVVVKKQQLTKTKLKEQKTQNSNNKIKQIKLKPKEYCHI